jgi:hypothetical protein
LVPKVFVINLPLSVQSAFSAFYCISQLINCLAQIFNQVIAILDPDRQAE